MTHKRVLKTITAKNHCKADDSKKALGKAVGEGGGGEGGGGGGGG